ncbi:MAG: hypothetical protein ABFD44_11320 [Anaerolineaceae bacterium]
MLKRTFALVVVSIITSASLLFVGTTVMGKFSPALAAPQGALVTDKSSSASISVQKEVPNTANQAVQVETTLATEVPSSSASETPEVTETPAAPSVPAPVVTIAQILSDPSQYEGQVVSISGIITQLFEEKILINDGTGQVLVEVDGSLSKIALSTGQLVTITGKLDDLGSHVKLEAYTITDQNGVVLFSKTEDDSSIDEDENNEDGSSTMEDSNDDHSGYTDESTDPSESSSHDSNSGSSDTESHDTSEHSGESPEED